MSAPRPGVTVFLTGLSGAGKSTIADALIAQLEGEGRPVTVLDGDVVRTHLSSELSFSKEHRDLNIRRIGWVAGEVVRHGGTGVVAAIAPYEKAREEARALVEEHGLARLADSTVMVLGVGGARVAVTGIEGTRWSTLQGLGVVRSDAASVAEAERWLSPNLGYRTVDE